MQESEQINEACDARVRRIVALHFDPDDGSPYWLERARALDFDPRKSIHSVGDLALLGAMDRVALAARPVEDFVPKRFHAEQPRWIVGETGGTLGRSLFCVHREDEFEAAFVRPFVEAARLARFPRGLHWLFIGPSGPHIIGKAARACARAMGSMDPFSVDFDPRWARKLPTGSVSRQRYLKHIEEQALDILAAQRIGVLFATPPVLQSLAERITPSARATIRGIHFGGMVVESELCARVSELFPNAILLAGYGNTLFGVAPELAVSDDTGIDYFAQGTRLVYRVIDSRVRNERERLNAVVGYGERGQVVAHRLDELQFIPNMIERDSAVRISPSARGAEAGFVLDGLRDPRPIVSENVKPSQGLY